MLVLDLDIARALIALDYDVGNYLCPRRSCALRLFSLARRCWWAKTKTTALVAKRGGPPSSFK